MAVFDPFGERSRRVLAALVVVGALAGAATVGAFVVDPAAAAPEPVAYDDTVELGLSSETDVLMRGDARIPRVQVFYSQLQYVVGYNGVESFVATIDDGRTETQFGYPLVVYVETFDGANPDVTGACYFTAERATEWIPAGDATYVAGSDAQSPAGETVVPFASRQAATAFAADHGGRVTDWGAVRRSSYDVDAAATLRPVALARWAAGGGGARRGAAGWRPRLRAGGRRGGVRGAEAGGGDVGGGPRQPRVRRRE